MPFALIVAIPLAALLLWALYSEQPPPRPVAARPGDWTGLPTPNDIRRHDFPVTVLGYDRGSIDDHLARVADAMAALLDEREVHLARSAVPPYPEGPLVPDDLGDAPGQEEDLPVDGLPVVDLPVDDQPVT